MINKVDNLKENGDNLIETKEKEPNNNPNCKEQRVPLLNRLFFKDTGTYFNLDACFIFCFVLISLAFIINNFIR